jgi:hypothetical protein
MKRVLVLKLFAAAMLMVGSFVTAPMLRGQQTCDPTPCEQQCQSTPGCVSAWCNFDGTCGQLVLL